MPGQTPKAGICVNSDEGGAGQKARQILQVWGSETESSSTSSRWGQDCSQNVENRGLNLNLGRKNFGSFVYKHLQPCVANMGYRCPGSYGYRFEHGVQ